MANRPKLTAPTCAPKRIFPQSNRSPYASLSEIHPAAEPGGEMFYSNMAFSSQDAAPRKTSRVFLFLVLAAVTMVVVIVTGLIVIVGSD